MTIQTSPSAPLVGPNSEFRRLFRRVQHSALHLGSRATYAQARTFYDRWVNGDGPDPEAEAAGESWLTDLRAVAGQALVHRIRAVSVPLTGFWRYQYDTVQPNLDAGEKVSWIDRRDLIDLRLPTVDYWLLDNNLVAVLQHDDDGLLHTVDFLTDAEIVRMYATAFEAVAARAIPHSEFRA
ncbi:DUF6879 family protein [Micromonospora sp. NPDC050417]|uniref:DUF6879 family protein n=1 Tax=Micromonospora sp. NPDC050417 TaxID=3364280 RepID=UPI0037989FD3